MYYLGSGVVKDYNKAFEYFSKSAESGVVEAKYYLGVMYYCGEGVTENAQKAFEYLQEPAEEGYSYANCILGVMYLYGNGVPKNYNYAVKYLNESIKESENPDARLYLAICYHDGLGVPKDLNIAREYIKQSVDGGNATAKEISKNFEYERWLNKVDDVVSLIPVIGESWRIGKTISTKIGEIINGD